MKECYHKHSIEKEYDLTHISGDTVTSGSGGFRFSKESLCYELEVWL